MLNPRTLGRGQPSPRGGYLPASLLLIRLPTTDLGRTIHPPQQAGTSFMVLSIVCLDMGGSSPVREYQPVVHRLRLSASP